MRSRETLPETGMTGHEQQGSQQRTERHQEQLVNHRVEVMATQAYGKM